MFFDKAKDWNKVKEILYKKAGRFAVIDWFELSKILGTNVKKIYIYENNYIVDERPFN